MHLSCFLLLFCCFFVVTFALNPFEIVTVHDIDGPGDGMYTQVRLADPSKPPLVSYLDASLFSYKFSVRDILNLQ